MATLTLIADPFPDWEAEVQSAAARDLAQGIADTAPRSCSARFLVSRGLAAPEFSSPRIRTEQLPIRANMLPIMWQSGATARPLDGEFVHALTPLMPLRARGDDDGSQTSVTIPHSLAWEAPALLGSAQARLFRSFTKRAVKHADVIMTPTHATARVLQEHYGADLPVQVMQLAPPSEFLRPADDAERRAALGLPERYALTTAAPGEHGRLEWLFDALRADPALPPIVALEGVDPGPGVRERDKEPTAPAALSVPEELQGRVIVARPRELADIGAVLSGAVLLLQPQSFLGAGYTLLGALSAAVPVLHAGHPATDELVLDAGVSADGAGAFAAEFSRLFRDPEALARLAVLACDRSRGFSWRSAGWQLWEAHANL
ncbi:mannosyltransferase [Leucobacter allii]|uniref:Mannosyltransferase n=1 Tax=Leucobacter allii TaxID=2932247 RepID=A0ABY4FN19_9MICO|nr:mannosyltransferase [Leucobacter allii]UOQ57679.1 mannosyltransferase [Leucobacter allii]